MSSYSMNFGSWIPMTNQHDEARSRSESMSLIALTFAERVNFLVGVGYRLCYGFAVPTTISHQAPEKDRRRFLAEIIATETLSLYVHTNDFAFVKNVMRCRYDEIVPSPDRTWLSEDFYCSFVEFSIRSADLHHHGEV